MKCKTILVLAPHTDDGELGCGATIARMVREGMNVHYVAFSSCRDSLPVGAEADCLIREMHAATAVLDIPSANVECLDYSVRHFEDHRQEILDSMLELKRRIKPDVVLSPSVHDIHQDHVTIANECLRAFKMNTILQYEVPWNNYTFDNQMFFCVEEADVQKKIAALKCYDSQRGRQYTQEDFLRGLLITHGVQIGHQYAEVFEVPRLIFKENKLL